MTIYAFRKSFIIFIGRKMTKRIKNIENFEDALSYSEFENLKKISKKLEDIMAIK